MVGGRETRMATIKRLLLGEKGVNLAEYSFLLGLIALVALAVVVTIGVNVSGLFDDPNLRVAMPS